MVRASFQGKKLACRMDRTQVEALLIKFGLANRQAATPSI
jgi:hypothetical protein